MMQPSESLELLVRDGLSFVQACDLLNNCNGRLFIEYSDGTIDNIWQNPANFQASLATVFGSFTLPAGVSSFRVGTEVGLDSGWLAFSDLTLTGWSDTIATTGGHEHTLDLHITGDLQAAQGQGGKIMAHYPGSSANPEMLWQNPINFNSSGTTVSQTFTPPAGITEVQFSYMVTMDRGWLAYSEPELQRLRPAYTITRKTYSFAGKTIATRISGNVEGDKGLFYIHADHLGSTSVMSYGQGHAQQGELMPGSRAHYLPFGDWRVEPAHELTDQGFTGQKHNMDLGLYYYNARFYLPGIGRFASADTIVPDPSNPQAYNRYTYVLNNPLRYTDPSGHCVEDPFDDYFDYECWQKAQQIYDEFGSQGLQYAALTSYSLEQLQKLDEMLRRVLSQADWIGHYSIRHVWVQWNFAIRNPGVTVEWPIPGSGSKGGIGRADLYREATGEIWEVKPHSPSGFSMGQKQLGRYVNNCPGTCYPGDPVVEIVRTIDPVNPTRDLYYSSWYNGSTHSGLIFYSTDNNHQRRVLDVAIDPNPIVIRSAAIMGAVWYLHNQVTRGGGYQPGLQPAFQ